MLERELKALPDAAACKDCTHFGPAGICNQFEQPVPDEFQAVGCESWEWDEVPF